MVCKTGPWGRGGGGEGTTCFSLASLLSNLRFACDVMPATLVGERDLKGQVASDFPNFPSVCSYLKGSVLLVGHVHVVVLTNPTHVYTASTAAN